MTLPSPALDPAGLRDYAFEWALVDVETSGLVPRRDRVLSVAVVTLGPDGERTDEFSTLLDPGCDPGPVHVHGLTAERLRGAPAFEQVADRIGAMLRDRVFVAHNAQFDYDFLAHEFARAGLVLPVARRLCTLTLNRRIDPPTDGLTLGTLAAHYGVEQTRAHDALDDARVLSGVLRGSLRQAALLDLPLPLVACPPRQDPRFAPKPPKAPCAYRNPGRAAPGGPLVQGMKIAVTGSTRTPRAELTAAAAAAGLNVMGSVSRHTSALVTNDGASGSAKARRAQAEGVPLFDEDTFLRLLNDVCPGTPHEEATALPAGAPAVPSPRPPQEPTTARPTPTDGQETAEPPATAPTGGSAPTDSTALADRPVPTDGPGTAEPSATAPTDHPAPTDRPALADRSDVADRRAPGDRHETAEPSAAAPAGHPAPADRSEAAVVAAGLARMRAGRVSGPLGGRRVLALGGTHAAAVAARARVVELGGAAAINLSASVTDVVVLDGGRADRRMARIASLELPVHEAGRLADPAGAGQQAAPGRADAVRVLPRGGVVDLPRATGPGAAHWTVTATWAQQASCEIDVVAFVVDEDEQVSFDDDFVFYGAPENPAGTVRLLSDGPTEQTVSMDLAGLPPGARKVVIAAAIDGAPTFGDIGAVHIGSGPGTGAVPLVQATLDAATTERSMLLAEVYRRGPVWRLRAVGQGYDHGLDVLARTYGVDVAD